MMYVIYQYRGTLADCLDNYDSLAAFLSLGASLVSYKWRKPDIEELQVHFCAAYFLQFSCPLFYLKVEGILAATIPLLTAFLLPFSFSLLAVHCLIIYYTMPNFSVLALIGGKLFLSLSTRLLNPFICLGCGRKHSWVLGCGS